MWKQLLKGRQSRQREGEGAQPPSQPNAASEQYSSISSIGPAVDYQMSPPVFSANEQISTSSITPWAVEYDRSAPVPDDGDNSRAGLRAEYRYPAANNVPQQIYASNHARIHELSNMGHGAGPRELPATPVPQRYELPTGSVPRPTLFAQRISPSDGFSGAKTTIVSGDQSSIGITPPPTSISNSDHNSPGQTSKARINNSMSPGTVSKYQGKVFCQRKAVGSGHAVLESPRDISEFRLAKVALIPIVAGERSFVSIDIVFGEIDKGISHLLEKHFLVTRETSPVPYPIPHAGEGASASVCKISNLKVAYTGHESVLYMDFSNSESDRKKFLDELESVRHLAET